MPEFPSSPYLSLFPDPPENPLSEGGKWAQTTPERPPMLKAGGAASDSEHGNPNYSHWAATIYDPGPDGIVEVWGCTTGGQLGAALETWRVALWQIVGASVSGYLLYYGGGIGKGYGLRRYDGGIGSFTAIGAAGGGYPERLGLRRDGDYLEMWGMYGGVWTLVGPPVFDNTYPGPFWLGISVEDPTVGGLGFPCFGGGIPRRTQFFRWTRGFKEPGEGTP